VELTPITVNGKQYLMRKIRRAGTLGRITVPHDYVDYFGTRNGERFGPVRSGSRQSRPGTIGRTIFDAAEEAANAEAPAPVRDPSDATWRLARSMAFPGARLDPQPDGSIIIRNN
jgi:hypothetical protein